MEVPDTHRTLDLWRGWAVNAGLAGIHFIGYQHTLDWDPEEYGFDAKVTALLPKRKDWVSRRNPYKWLKNKIEIKLGYPSVYQFSEVLDSLILSDGQPNRYPCVIPNWDNTPRSKSNGLVLQGSTPELFRIQLRKALAATSHMHDGNRLIFLKSWNEWAEGNYVEPDLKFGHGYLKVIKEEFNV